MTENEITRVQSYLQKLFANPQITIAAPARAGAPVEVSVGGEFIGIVYRDEDEGEVSYALNMSILEGDLDSSL